MFNVCRRHFCARDFSGDTNKEALNIGAVPSVFKETVLANDVIDEIDSTEIQIIGDGIINDEIHAKNQYPQCPFLIQKVADLKKEILTLKVKHNIEVQKLQRKLSSLQDKNEERTDRIKQFEKDLTKEKKQNVRLRDVIIELKNQNFISAEEGNMLNVCMTRYCCINNVIIF